MRDLALPRDLDTESEQTAFTVDSELPPAGLTHLHSPCPGEVKQVKLASELETVK